MEVVAIVCVSCIPGWALWPGWLADPGVVSINAVKVDAGGGERAGPAADLNTVVLERHDELVVARVIGAVKNQASLARGDGGGDEADDIEGDLHLEGLDENCGWEEELAFGTIRAETMYRKIQYSPLSERVCNSSRETKVVGKMKLPSCQWGEKDEF